MPENMKRKRDDAEPPLLPQTYDGALALVAKTGLAGLSSASAGVCHPRDVTAPTRDLLALVAKTGLAGLSSASAGVCRPPEATTTSDDFQALTERVRRQSRARTGTGAAAQVILENPDILLLVYRFVPTLILRHASASRSFRDLAREYNALAKIHFALSGARPMLHLKLTAPFSTTLYTGLFGKLAALSVQFLPGSLPRDDATLGLGRMFSACMPPIQHLDVSALETATVLDLFSRRCIGLLREVKSIKLGDALLRSDAAAARLELDITKAQIRLREWDLSWTSRSNYGQPLPPEFLFQSEDKTLQTEVNVNAPPKTPQWAELECLALRHAELWAQHLHRITEHVIQRGAAASLRTLDLTGARVDGRIFFHLETGLKQCTALRKLALGGNPCLGLLGAQSLASALPALSSCLQELDLADSDLRDDGLRALGAGLAAGLEQLQVLRLGSNKISDAGLREWFAVPPRVPRLTELALESNAIALRKEAAEALCSFLSQQTRVRAVDLRGQGVTVLSAGRLKVRKHAQALAREARRVVAVVEF
jgi:hypothetical protein